MALTAKKVYAILKRQISDMEAKLNSPVRYRGTVATADLLPLNPDIGDMYNIESKSVYGEAGMNVAWNGVVWDTMGAPIDMSLYIKSSELADWVKQQSKPTYTAEEVGALPADTKIPSKTSDLQNDSGFLTKVPDNYLSGTDKTLSVSGKAADAKTVGDKNVELLADILSKLDKNQGSENSGKIAGINESGDIVPMFPVGVEYNSETNCLEFGSDQKMKLNQGIGLDSTLTKTGVAADAGVTGKEISSLKEDLGDLADIYTQYLDPNTLENKKLWTGDVNKSTNESWGYFNAYDAFELSSGIYTFLDDIYIEYSYLVGSNNTFIKLTSYLGITDLNWHGDISFTENVKLYISIYRTDSNDRKCRMIRKKDIEESKVPYEKGIFLVKLNDKTSISISQIDGAYLPNYSIFEQAYIKGSELVANRITPTSRNAIAHYTAVKMSNNVISVKAKIKFYGYAFSTFIAEPNGMTKVTDITKKSIHINMSRTKYYIGYFDGYSLTNVITGDMSGVTEGEEKTVGFDLNLATNTITVYLPNGEEKTHTSERWANVTGAYAIWEHYIDITSQEFVCNHFTKLWAKDSDSNVLCDDLKRFDGAIGVSPQGYYYGQFTNLNPNGWEL